MRHSSMLPPTLLITFLTFLTFSSTFVRAAASPPTLVYPVQAQRPPVARVNQTWSWSLLPETFNTSSGSTLTLSTRSLPAWASFDANTYTFAGLPGVADVGSRFVTIQANATGVATGTTDGFTLLVVEDAGPYVKSSIASQLPTASSLGDGATYAADGALRVPPNWSFSLGFQQYTFQDPSLSRIYYTAYETGTTVLPSWLTFDNKTVTFDGVAPASLGEMSFTVFGSDHFGYGDVQQSFSLTVGYHYLSLASALPAFNATVGKAFNYTIPTSSVILDNTTISATNLSSVEVNLANLSYISYDATSHIISGSIPSTVTPSTFSIPITFRDAYNDTVATNVSMAILAAPISTSSFYSSTTSHRSTSTSTTPAPTSSSSELQSHHGLSHGGKLAIALVFGIIGGLILLIGILACCRRHMSDEQKIRRDASTLIFDQATIAAAQKSTGGTTFVSRFKKPKSEGEKTPQTEPFEHRPSGTSTPVVAHPAPAAMVEASPSKPKRLNLMGIFKGGTPKKEVSAISLPISQHSLYGLGLADSPTQHNILVVGDAPNGTYVPGPGPSRVDRGDRVPTPGESDVDRTSSWGSGGSSSLFYSEGSEGGGRTRRPRPRGAANVPQQRRDFVPIPINTDVSPPIPDGYGFSPTRSNSASPTPSPSSGSFPSSRQGGIRLVESPTRDVDGRYLASTDSGHSVAGGAARLIPFTHARTGSQTNDIASRRISSRVTPNPDPATEDADESPDRRSALYIPPPHQGPRTTSAVFYNQENDWNRSSAISASEYGAPGSTRIASSVGSEYGDRRRTATSSMYVERIRVNVNEPFRFHPQIHLPPPSATRRTYVALMDTPHYPSTDRKPLPDWLHFDPNSLEVWGLPRRVDVGQFAFLIMEGPSSTRPSYLTPGGGDNEEPEIVARYVLEVDWKTGSRAMAYEGNDDGGYQIIEY